jgi:murein DD-endopeptidase MepM/ murein hydrolase activator NlpD
MLRRMRFPLAVVGVLLLAPAPASAVKPKVPVGAKDKPAEKKPAEKKAAKKPVDPKPGKSADQKAAKKPPASKVKLWVSSEKPKPGDPVLVKVTGTTTMPRGTADRRRLAFYPVKGGWQAVFGVPLGDAPEAEEEEDKGGFWDIWRGGGAAAAPADKTAARTIKITIADTGVSKTLTVKPRAFPEEAITIDAALADPPANQAKEIDADNAAVIAALRNSDPPLFKGRFRAPAGKKSSAFGNWRRFNGSEHKSRHLGLDVVARKGAPIRAVQRGKVALVRSGILMGGTVVVVHGAGLASCYFHVSDFAVKAGEVVEPGQVLGKVGLTGRTTGPHIHVGLWARGGFVDPAAFFRLPLAAPLAPPATVTTVAAHPDRPARRGK